MAGGGLPARLRQAAEETEAWRGGPGDSRGSGGCGAGELGTRSRSAEGTAAPTRGRPLDVLRAEKKRADVTTGNVTASHRKRGDPADVKDSRTTDWTRATGLPGGRPSP